MKQIKLTPATKQDINQLLDIAYECFDEPWGAIAFNKALKSDKVVCAKLGADVVAYMVYFVDVSGDIEIFNIAVKENFRREGIGTLLVNVLENLNPAKIATNVLECDLSAQLFFRALGFTCTKINHRDYKSELLGKILDTYSFEKEILVSAQSE